MAHAAFPTRGDGRAATRRHRPVGEKESQRWLDGAEAAASVCAGARQIVVVSDREADIYAGFAPRSRCSSSCMPAMVPPAADRCAR